MRNSTVALSMIVSFATVALAPGAAQSAFAQSDGEHAAHVYDGRYRGAFTVPGQGDIEFFVTVSTDAEGAQSGSVDIPAQGVADLALSDVEFDDEGVSFHFAQVGAAFDGAWAEGGQVTGTVSQQGFELDFTLRRAEEGEGEGPAVDLGDNPLVYTGAAEFPGLKLEFITRFAQSVDGSWVGAIDVPLQNMVGVPLRDIDISEDAITFVFQPAGAPVGADFSFTREVHGGFAGSVGQGGQTFPATLKESSAEEAANVGPRRPQTPAPPFPYAAEEVVFENTADGVTLAGTLTIPDGPGPHPAAILLTGSGPQDRDETIAGHQPFLVIADHLTRNGIAVLRFDDRGMGGSSGSTLDSTVDDFARDASAAMDFLRGRDEVDIEKIGLIGHSEGGAVAPVTAAARSDVAFIVTLAGMSLSGGDTLLVQLPLILRAAGVSEEQIEMQSAAQRRLVDAILAGASREELAAPISDLIQLQAGTVDDSLLEQQLNQMDSAWFRHLMAFDPAPALRQVQAPVLALNGGLDMQVPPKAMLVAMERELRAGGNADVTTIELPGLNHLFQTAETGALSEYARIEETFSPRALEIMTRWLHAKVDGG